jgi:hypothetical protein
MPKEILNKFDAATRQLDTAISLWFSGGDAVSIHTLACSAHQIIHDINQQKGWHDLLYDSLVIKKEFQPEFKRFLKSHYNYFKHSKKDIDKTIEFDSSLTELIILFSIIGLELFGIKQNDIRKAFTFWHAIQYPDRFTEKLKKQYVDNIPSDIISAIRSMSRSSYFNKFTLGMRQFSSQSLK